FQEAYAALLPAASAVALCGSLPPGVPVGAYAGLLRTARAAGVPTLLDTSGSALRRGIAGRPGILKPNADELAELTGPPEPSTAPAPTARRPHPGPPPAGGRARWPPPWPGRPARRDPRGPLARHSPGPPARQPDRRGRLGRRGPAVGPGREPPLAGPPHPRGRPVGGDGPLPGGRRGRPPGLRGGAGAGAGGAVGEGGVAAVHPAVLLLDLAFLDVQLVQQDVALVAVVAGDRDRVGALVQGRPGEGLGPALGEVAVL